MSGNLPRVDGQGKKLEFACGSLIPGCDAVFDADTEDELLSQVAAHARDAHDIEPVSPELAERVRSEIRGRE